MNFSFSLKSLSDKINTSLVYKMFDHYKIIKTLNLKIRLFDTVMEIIISNYISNGIQKRFSCLFNV